MDYTVKALNALKTYWDLNQKDFAEKIGISPPALHYILSGKTKINIDLLSKLISDFKIKPYWLLFGQEPMFKEFADSSEDKTDNLEIVINTYKTEPQFKFLVDQLIKGGGKLWDGLTQMADFLYPSGKYPCLKANKKSINFCFDSLSIFNFLKNNSFIISDSVFNSRRLLVLAIMIPHPNFLTQSP